MLYVDYLSTVKIENQVSKFSGGSNYVRRILSLIKSYAIQKQIRVFLIIHKQYQPVEDVDRDLFGGGWYEEIRTDSLLAGEFREDSILFLPQVNGSLLRLLPKIRQLHPTLKMYGTLHDRQHNYCRYDWADRFYFNGFRRTGIPGFFLFYLKRWYFNIHYSRWAGALDKLFTVSNYSLQKLADKRVKYIKPFYQGNYLKAADQGDKDKYEDDFILFVGGSRPEKNLLRTIRAFCRFREHYPESSLKLYITGVSQPLVDNLAKGGRVDKEICAGYIQIFDYVPYEDLNTLYECCKFVMFVSKGEGFGLPVLEALMHGKTVLASWQTSIPEVAGAILQYVDACDVDSIFNGIVYLANEHHLKTANAFVQEKLEVINRQIQLDDKVLMHELFDL